MKNAWLWEVTIGFFSDLGWYVIKTNEALKSQYYKEKRMLSFTTPYTFYLHNDGRWLSTTQSEKGWSGYYQSREDAQAALDKYGLRSH